MTKTKTGLTKIAAGVGALGVAVSGLMMTTPIAEAAMLGTADLYPREVMKVDQDGNALAGAAIQICGMTLRSPDEGYRQAVINGNIDWNTWIGYGSLDDEQSIPWNWNDWLEPLTEEERAAGTKSGIAMFEQYHRQALINQAAGVNLAAELPTEFPENFEPYFISTGGTIPYRLWRTSCVTSVTDDLGKAAYPGSVEGSFWINEVKAPEGYIGIDGPVLGEIGLIYIPEEEKTVKVQDTNNDQVWINEVNLQVGEDGKLIPWSGTMMITVANEKSPENPEEPKEPEQPEKPEKPEVPENPEEPKEPEQPEQPEKPEVPESPEEPEKPEQPEKPDKPETPQSGGESSQSGGEAPQSGGGDMPNKDTDKPIQELARTGATSMWLLGASLSLGIGGAATIAATRKRTASN